MKTLQRFNFSTPLRFFVFIVVLICFGVSCDFTTIEDVNQTYYDNSELSITQFIENRSEDFSILYDILDTTGLKHLFRTYGAYTFLAPTDSAFKIYFEEIGKSSYKDFEVSELNELIRYHVFTSTYKAGDFNMGIIETKTLSGNYMVSTPSVDGTDVLLNKMSRMIYRDNILPNGILHGVDKVIEKPTKSIYNWLEDEGTYTLILEAIEKTGLDKIIKIDPEDLGQENEFYSCFFTTDEIYAESNISSFADLADFYSPNGTNYKESINTLNVYVGSHFVKGVFSMSDATEDEEFFGTYAGPSIGVSLTPNTAEVVLNSKTSDFPTGLNVNEFSSNNLVENGIVHVMDTMYQITSTFRPTRKEFIFLDVPGFPFDSLVAVGDSLADLGIKAATDETSKYWPATSAAQHLPFDKTSPWLTLNKPYSGKIRSDAHRNLDRIPMFLNFEYCDDLLDFTRKIPYVIPGKYYLYNYCKPGLERPTVKHFFNGEQIGGIVNLSREKNDVAELLLGVVEIPEGQEENYFRVEAISPGNGLFIGVILEPVD